MILETQRLLLRELQQEDFDSLCKIMQDEITMKAYEHAFSDQEVQTWLDKQLTRYRQDGFGLWAVILKETNEMIGQCGLTMQDYNEVQIVEVGYLFQRKFWHHGYATEAATACRNYAFTTYPIDEVYSIIRDTNVASVQVALRNSMTKQASIVKYYYGVTMPHDIYSIKRSEFDTLAKDKVIE